MPPGNKLFAKNLRDVRPCMYVKPAAQLQGAAGTTDSSFQALTGIVKADEYEMMWKSHDSIHHSCFKMTLWENLDRCFINRAHIVEAS